MICTIPDCENLAERSGVCASHSYILRKAEKTAKREAEKKASQKQIAKVSDKMALALKEYAKLRKEFLAKNRRCIVFPDLPATEIHHSKGRATIELLLQVRYWKPVSREGHQWIHANPKDAIEKTFSLSRLATEPNNTI